MLKHHGHQYCLLTINYWLGLFLLATVYCLLSSCYHDFTTLLQISADMLVLVFSFRGVLTAPQGGATTMACQSARAMVKKYCPAHILLLLLLEVFRLFLLKNVN